MKSRTEKVTFWTKTIKELQCDCRKKVAEAHIVDYQYHDSLPTKLRARVEKIISLDFLDPGDESDENGDGKSKQPDKSAQEDSEEDAEKGPPDDISYNESTCSEVNRQEVVFPYFKLAKENQVERKKSTGKKTNWCSTYICLPREERIKWQSKIYDMDVNIWEKPLDEQADHLMDASAERFSNWLCSVGSDRSTDITKEQIRALFSIEGNQSLMAAIQMDPKEVHAIAKTVADRWNLPEMALELKYENYINNRLKNIPKKVITVAFGRTVPYSVRPWLPSANDRPIKTVFPKDLTSGENIFSGITDMRSTKAYVEHLKRHPTIRRPEYLVRKGHFKDKAAVVEDTEVPLYERLKLNF